MTDCNFLFVYGSLRKSIKNEMSDLLKAHSNFVDHATFQGKLFEVKDYPGVIPSKNAEDIVHGEVFELAADAEIFSKLDKYEECGSDSPQPAEYRRERQKVRLPSGQLIFAWIYLYNRNTDQLKRIESGDFSDSCKTS